MLSRYIVDVKALISPQRFKPAGSVLSHNCIRCGDDISLCCFSIGIFGKCPQISLGYGYEQPSDVHIRVVSHICLRA